MEWISNLIFECNDSQILFGIFQGFKKATPYGGARKLRVTLSPVCRAFQTQIVVTVGNFMIFAIEGHSTISGLIHSIVCNSVVFWIKATSDNADSVVLCDDKELRWDVSRCIELIILE